MWQAARWRGALGAAAGAAENSVLLFHPCYFTQDAGDALVAGAVALEFVAPEGAVGGGECAVEGAGVPEAAVDEEGAF